MAKRGFRIDRPMVLIGLMGAGKTTVGRRLAQSLQIPFADSDDEIERTEGLSVSEIFDRHGEPHFREAERRAIRDLIERGPQVIAAGGGAFLDEVSRALMLKRCVTIWIQAEVETLAERVARQNHRPLLTGKSPFQALAGLAEQRNPLYARAHLVVRGDCGEPDQVADQIIAALERREVRA